MEFTKPDWQYSYDASKRVSRKPQDPLEEEWPDRTAVGKRVEIEYRDGRIFDGRLEIEETILAGAEEEPLFVVVDDAGRRHGFINAVRWRFIGH
jgi:hypothetical protein